jgi:transglutaminase-like putative cysteine protease
MAKFKIRHITKYTYEETVRDSANQFMLYPIKDQYQDVLQHQITISGNPIVSVHRDYYGNEVGTFTHARPHKELDIDSKLIVQTTHRPEPNDTTEAAAQWKELENLKYQLDFIDFLKQEKFEALPEVKKITEDEYDKYRTPLQTVKHLCEYIYKNFTYKKGITTVETTVDEIWKIRSGVCQDFAHILLVMLRLLNIPARYVSGYVCPSNEGMRGEGATHAWVEAYIPFYGWLGVDPTNNCLANDTHVRLAIGKNFSDCSPVKGTYRGTSNHTLEVTVAVTYEDGRTSEADHQEVKPEKAESFSKNSFRRYQEMQMQQ